MDSFGVSYLNGGVVDFLRDRYGVSGGVFVVGVGAHARPASATIAGFSLAFRSASWSAASMPWRSVFLSFQAR